MFYAGTGAVCFPLSENALSSANLEIYTAQVFELRFSRVADVLPHPVLYHWL